MQSLSLQLYHPTVRFKAEWEFPLAEFVSAMIPGPQIEYPLLIAQAAIVKSNYLNSNIHNLHEVKELKKKKNQFFKPLYCTSLPFGWVSESFCQVPMQFPPWNGKPHCGNKDWPRKTALPSRSTSLLHCHARASTWAEKAGRHQTEKCNSIFFVPLQPLMLGKVLETGKTDAENQTSPDRLVFSNTSSCWCINLSQDTNRWSKTCL